MSMVLRPFKLKKGFLKRDEMWHLWPLETVIRVNDVVCPIKQRKILFQGRQKKAKGGCDPADILSLCREGANTIVVQCTDPDDYAFLVQLAENVHLQTIANEVPETSLEAASLRVNKSFGDTDEVAATSTRLSLKCPLGLIPIHIPARGVGCRHLQCFDLMTYLSYNKTVRCA